MGITWSFVERSGRLPSGIRGASISNRSFAVALRGIPVALCGFGLASAVEELGRSQFDLQGFLMSLRRPPASLNSSISRTVGTHLRR